MNKYAIAFDVGGLFIKSAVLDDKGHVLPGTYAIYPAKSKEQKEVIIEHFVGLIKHQTNRILDKSFEIYGVGYAFPGPFDYPGGISYIRQTDKFEHLYGVNLREELTMRLEQDPLFVARRADRFQIRFENDANLFALGELFAGHARAFNRSICLTIGTGTGSAFIDNGQLIANRADVPPNGWVYKEPFGASIVDDYISKRGILRLAQQAGMKTEGMEVKAIADMARGGDAVSRGVFHQFGRNLGMMLNPFVAAFRPEAVIIGGQIAKSKDLFLDGVSETLQNSLLAIRTVDETSLSTFVGIAQMLTQSAAKA